MNEHIITNVEELSWDEVLPTDSAVIRDTLPNGVECAFVRQPGASKEITAQLVVKTGTFNAKDRERGYLQVIGALTAHLPRQQPASAVCVYEYEKTSFVVVAPVDSSQAIGFTHFNSAIKLLSDIGLRMTFDDEELFQQLKEAQVRDILAVRTPQAERETRGFALALHGTPYAQKSLQGHEVDVSKATRDSLRQFYASHFVPANLAVFVVGDFDDPQIVKDCIYQNFADVASSHPGDSSTLVSQRLDLLTQLHFDNGPIYSIQKANSLQKTFRDPSIHITFRRPIDLPTRIIRQEQAKFYVDLIVQLLKKRCVLIQNRFHGRCRSVRVGASDLATSTLHSISIVVELSPDGSKHELEILKSVLLCVESLKHLETDQVELELLGKQCLAQEKARYNSSSSVLGLLTDTVLYNEPYLGEQLTESVGQLILAHLDSTDVKDIASAILDFSGCTILLVEGTKVNIQEHQLAKLVQEVRLSSTDVQQREETMATRQLAPPGKIVDQIVDQANGKATVWRLSNDLTTFIHPFDLGEDDAADLVDVVLTADGGSIADVFVTQPEKFPSAMVATILAQFIGIGGINFSKTDPGFQVVEFTPYLFERTIKFSCHKRNIERLLSFIYSLFTDPLDTLWTPEACKRELQELKLQTSDSERLMTVADAILTRATSLNWQDNPLINKLSSSEIDKIDIEFAKNFLKQAYSNPAEFQVHFIGQIAAQSVAPLVEKFLASIPTVPGAAAQTQEKMVYTLTQLANKITFKPGVTRDRIQHQKSFLTGYNEPTGIIQITFPIPNVATRLEFDTLEIVATIVESLLFQTQQNIKDASAILNSKVSPQHPFSTYFPGEISIAIECIPTATEQLVEATLKAIDDFRENPDQSIIDEALTLFVAGREGGVVPIPSYLKLDHKSKQLFGLELDNVQIDQVFKDPEMVQEVLAFILPPENYSVITYTPDKVPEVRPKQALKAQPVSARKGGQGLFLLAGLIGVVAIGAFAVMKLMPGKPTSTKQ